MSVGFGFSIGDFIAAVDLFRKVTVALKDSGGARDDYLKTLSNLETLQSILGCRTNIKVDTHNSASGQAIQRLAHLIKKDVEDFVNKIDKFKATLGPTKSRHLATGVVAKIKWSQYAANNVRKLYQEIDVKTTSLNLLIDLYLR